MERTSNLRRVLVPDRLLIAELSALGPFCEVPEYFFYRRYLHKVTRARQRRNFFPNGAPLYTYLPITLQHFWVLYQDFSLRRLAEPKVSASKGLTLAKIYGRSRIRSFLLRCLSKIYPRNLSKKLPKRIGKFLLNRSRILRRVREKLERSS